MTDPSTSPRVVFKSAARQYTDDDLTDETLDALWQRLGAEVLTKEQVADALDRRTRDVEALLDWLVDQEIVRTERFPGEGRMYAASKQQLDEAWSEQVLSDEEADARANTFGFKGIVAIFGLAFLLPVFAFFVDVFELDVDPDMVALVVILTACGSFIVSLLIYWAYQRWRAE